MSSFVHLRVHTEFSLCDGLLRIDSLMKAVKEQGMHAIAITDVCNLFAVIKAYQAALKEGIKPLIGADIVCHYPEKPEETSSLVLLCCNSIGYKNLTLLISKAYQEGQYLGKAYVQYEWLFAHQEGLIVLSGGRTGLIGKMLLASKEPQALSLANRFQTVFGNRFYLEIQRTGRPEENEYNAKVVALADKLHLPLVATNEVCFLKAADFDAHEARVCIHQGVTLIDPKRKKEYSPQQYLRSAEEMAALFSDLPGALQNTVAIARRCTVELTLGNSFLPTFPIPSGSSIEVHLSSVAKQGLEERFRHFISPLYSTTVYQERLQRELEVIQSMGFSGYFLIVADFIQWARDNDVPVGPGRGSGAGSLVAYALKITDLDPLQYDLLFERFLNPERVSMPDFDIDFCMEGRDKVIEYVAQKYGRQSVSQIITFGTMAARAVVRDVGRVLGHPYGFVDKIAKLIPFELGMTLQKALEIELELKNRFEEEEEVKELMTLALTLEGITRNAGKHAGGVVIAPSQLTDFTAIYCEQNSEQIVSQLDKDDVEAVGLVKFDFLGLRTLTIIDWTQKTINAQKPGEPLNINSLPMDDKRTFDMLKNGDTTAIFQLESMGMKKLIHRLQPDCFEEIIALVALFRPGPLQSGMVDDFIDRKHGHLKVEYLHPELEPILKPTYGVILYQEQVMQIAQALAGYTLGAADLLRRAMGKKKPEEMAKQRTIFTQGATARGVPIETATLIFDLMEKFAGYGFNKSHSAAYALLSYQTAWLKAHFPAAFMAAVMSADMINTDKIVLFKQDCASRGLTILPPCIQRSHYYFTIEKESLLFGLGAIKGIGESAINAIIAEREAHGSFASLFDVCNRLDTRKVNKRAIEVLIGAGAMDSFGVDRAGLCASMEKALLLGDAFQKRNRSGQHTLWALLEEEEEEYVAVPPWNAQQKLASEMSTLGFYLSGHPTSIYAQELQDKITLIAALNPVLKKTATICGMVTNIKRMISKQGKNWMILTLEDATGRQDMALFSELTESIGADISLQDIYCANGEIKKDEWNGSVRMVVKELYDIATMRADNGRFVLLKIQEDQQLLWPSIVALLESHPGKSRVQVEYTNAKARGLVTLGQAWAVTPKDALFYSLRGILGENNVLMCY